VPPRPKPTEVLMLECYDPVTDGSVSRWSFHRTDRACRRPMPQERPGPVLCLLLKDLIVRHGGGVLSVRYRLQCR
jgi:hypothetical protein